MTDRTYELLDQALALLRDGATIDEALAASPADAAELEPLLRSALEAESTLSTSMPAPARARTRARAMDAWDRRRRPRRGLLDWLPRIAVPAPAAAALLAIVVALGGGTGTVAASGSSIPGDFLYPVKQVREKAEVWLALSAEDRISAYTALVNRRVEEIQALTAAERSADLPLAVDRLARHVEAIEDLAASADDPRELAALQDMTAQALAAHTVLIDNVLPTSVDARAELIRAIDLLAGATARVKDASEALQRGLIDGQ